MHRLKSRALAGRGVVERSGRGRYPLPASVNSSAARAGENFRSVWTLQTLDDPDVYRRAAVDSPLSGATCRVRLNGVSV